MENIIEVKNLKKTYLSRGHKTEALKGISFEVKRGEIFGILGVNGAGKSTTLSILMDLLTPTSGTIEFFGKDFRSNTEEVKSRMNIATAYADLATNLSIYENLTIYGLMYNVRDYKTKIAGLLKQFEITHLAGARFGELSAGQKTRVNLCKSLINDPEILLLDEPTASLDPAIAEQTRELLLDLQENHRRTIVFTSHNMPEVEELCDRVALLDHGLIYRIDTPANLVADHNAPDLEEVFIKLAKGEYEE